MITLGLGIPKRRESSGNMLQAVPEIVERRDPSSAVLQALSETVAWCLSKSLQSGQLRSRELDPSAILKVPSLDEVGVDVLLQKMRESYQRAIYEINEARSILIRDTNIKTADRALAQSRGKLLLYHPLETVTDGAAASSSRGFFDISDAPPWDTWFLYSGDTIFSWVPESWVPNAQAGIDANPVDCIHWCAWSKLSEPLI
jgi:hypothetical protein